MSALIQNMSMPGFRWDRYYDGGDRCTCKSAATDVKSKVKHCSQGGQVTTTVQNILREKLKKKI